MVCRLKDVLVEAVRITTSRRRNRRAGLQPDGARTAEPGDTRRHILLLDDEEAILVPTAHYFRRLGWSVDCAREPEVGVWRFSTDGTYSAGVAGIPSIGFSPQEEQFVHTAQDQVNLRKLREAVAFLGILPHYVMQE